MIRTIACFATIGILAGCSAGGPRFQDTDAGQNAALEEAAGNIAEGDGGEHPSVQRRRDRIGEEMRASSRHPDPKIP